MMRYTTLRCTGEQEWLIKRLQHVCSSDAAAIHRASPWGNRLTVWADKVGIATIEEVDKPLRFDCGHALEPLIAQQYTKETGIEITDPGDYTLQISKDFPWCASTVDRFADDRIVEIKTAQASARAKYEEHGVPEHYIIQVQWQMLVTGYERADIVVLFGHDAIDWYTIEADWALQKQLLDESYAFWFQNVVKEIPPELDGHPEESSVIPHMGNEPEEDRAIELDASYAHYADFIDRTTAWIKKKEERINLLKNELKMLIATNDVEEALIYGADHKWTYKENTSGNRVLRKAKV